MRDLAVDYARDLRGVGICVSAVVTCCRFLRVGGFCLLPFFGYNTTMKKIHNYPFQKLFVTSQNIYIYIFCTITIILSINSIIVYILFAAFALITVSHAGNTQIQSKS